jgi:hypothetical protein
MYDKPLPVIDGESRPYWDALKQHRLTLKRCHDCGKHHFYPRVLCPHCHSDAVEWVDACGTGTIYSFTIARRPAGPAFKADTPTWCASPTKARDDPHRHRRVEAVRIGQRVTVRTTT